MPNQKIFNQLLFFVNLYQHAENKAVSSICSEEIVDLKILQSLWLRAFWPISQEQDFFQMQICARTQHIIKIFIIVQIQRKLMTKFFFILKKKLIFWPIFDVSSIFGAKNLMIQFQENTQTDGRRDPISQDPSGYHQGSNNYNCSRLAFKSQRYRVQFWSNKKLFHHNQHAKNQLNS